MQKIKYHVTMLQYSTGSIYVEPLLQSNIKSQHHNLIELILGENKTVYWAWTPAYMAVLPLSQVYKRLNYSSTTPLWTTHAVVKKENKEHYIQIMYNLFSSFRCGVDPIEMYVKVHGQFIGPDWFELDLLTIPINRTTLIKAYQGTIKPLHGILANCLELDLQKDMPKVSLETWVPTDPLDYEIIWHFLIQLSNGEQHFMQVPICSVHRWFQRVEQYFKVNPNAISSPNLICQVIPSNYNYSYEKVVSQLHHWTNRIRASSPSEVLLKLSSFLNYDKRAVHLQKILSDPEVELKFTGEVIWHPS